jgi:hypothetical protein
MVQLIRPRQMQKKPKQKSISINKIFKPAILGNAMNAILKRYYYGKI